jgi:hypothetical protein
MMDWTATNPNLRFERHPRSLPHRLIAIGVSLGVFTLLWTLVPQGALYWLLAPLLAGLVWAASYGWRQALAALIALLHRLQRL